MKCPACPKIFLAKHKVYAAGSRKRKNNQKSVVTCRKAVWYFGNLQNHLTKNHSRDEIEELAPDNEDTEGSSYILSELNESYVELESTSTSCNNHNSPNQAATVENLAAYENTTYVDDDYQNIIEPIDVADNSNNGANTSKQQTPKKTIVQRFFAQLNSNEERRSGLFGADVQY